MVGRVKKLFVFSQRTEIRKPHRHENGFVRFGAIACRHQTGGGSAYRDCNSRNGDVRQHHEHAHDEPDEKLAFQLIWRAVQESSTQAPAYVFC